MDSILKIRICSKLPKNDNPQKKMKMKHQRTDLIINQIYRNYDKTISALHFVIFKIQFLIDGKPHYL